MKILSDYLEPNRGVINIGEVDIQAATMTAMLPIASLRLHSQIERILLSPSR
jgi:hypothetical protein